MSTSLGSSSGHVRLRMNSAFAATSPDLRAFGFIASSATMKQKTNAMSMLNNMS